MQFSSASACVKGQQNVTLKIEANIIRVLSIGGEVLRVIHIKTIYTRLLPGRVAESVEHWYCVWEIVHLNPWSSQTK